MKNPSHPFRVRGARNRVSGFTLLELLVVVVIIGLLVSYVGPRYFSQVGKSEVGTAKAQIDATAVGTFSMEQVPTLVDDVVEGGPELAPAQYRDLVAEYYKALNKEL